MNGKRFGRYTLLGDLGSGGMGRVYRARDSVLGRDVALKLLHDGDGGEATEESMRVLLQEARAAAAIDHPNAVAIFDVGEIDRQPFLAMELISGKTLRELLSEGATPLAVRVAWLIDVANALAAAHRGRVLHRDVKPDNVLVRDDDGVVKVVDFGIARPLASIDRGAATQSMRLDEIMSGGAASAPILTAGIRGTPSYMAPEQLRGEALDGRADQFAWGILAYELLSGVHPWPSRDALGTVRGIASEPAPSLRSRAPAVSEALERIIQRALEKKREARFGSMDDLVQALRSDALVIGESSTKRAYSSLGGALFAIVAGCMIVVAVLSPSAPPVPRSRTVASPPAPLSANADAVASYREGVQLVRDGSRSAAVAAFEKAAAIDPTFAAAHLRAAMFVDVPDSALRTHLQQAAQFRNKLSEYERGLLWGFEPWANAPADWNESARRLSQVTNRYADESEAWLALGSVRWHATDDAGAIDAFERAIRLDPSQAVALDGIGRIYLHDNELKESELTFRRCIEISPASASCIKALILFMRAQGDCSLEEAMARRLIAISPHDPGAYRTMANAAYGANYDVGMAREIFARALPFLPVAEREIAERAAKTRLAVLDGDFELAEIEALRWESIVSSLPDESRHISPAWYRTAIALESGRRNEVARRGNAYLARRSGWMPNDYAQNPAIYIDQLLYRGGAIDQAQMNRARANWLLDETERQRKTGDSRPIIAWTVAYAESAVTQADAEEALAELPRFGVVLNVVDGGIDFEASLGEVYRLVGARSEAALHLNAATTACEAVDYPFQHIWSWLRLGRLAEANGERTAACSAYRNVLQRWGKSRTSTTVREARASTARLGCD